MIEGAGSLKWDSDCSTTMIEGAGSLKWDSDCSTTMVEGAGRAATVLFV
jgi:hypothetical protein